MTEYLRFNPHNTTTSQKVKVILLIFLTYTELHFFTEENALTKKLEDKDIGCVMKQERAASVFQQTHLLINSNALLNKCSSTGNLSASHTLISALTSLCFSGAAVTARPSSARSIHSQQSCFGGGRLYHEATNPAHLATAQPCTRGELRAGSAS